MTIAQRLTFDIDDDDVIATSGHEVSLIKTSAQIVLSTTHLPTADQFEAKRSRILVRDDSGSSSLYRVQITGDALTRKNVNKTRSYT